MRRKMKCNLCSRHWECSDTIIMFLVVYAHQRKSFRIMYIILSKDFHGFHK
ncbi:unnamed protein product [Linum tenue]|uniref:Uncharacterized protein n=1 Tax=Linum tenue TaxID=586396 RepID=A0AAV0QAX4_9ROSI|nr:unnamed protein product [Linum tenue]